jgi:hypothetical protein
MKMNDYEQVYDEFWKDIVENEDGTLNVDAVKRELADFRHMLNEVPAVYEFVTGGMLSKPNYYARDVISAASDYIERCIEEGLQDYLAGDDL